MTTYYPIVRSKQESICYRFEFCEVLLSIQIKHTRLVRNSLNRFWSFFNNSFRLSCFGKWQFWSSRLFLHWVGVFFSFCEFISVFSISVSTFLLKITEELFKYVISSLWYVNPLQNVPESCLFSWNQLEYFAVKMCQSSRKMCGKVSQPIDRRILHTDQITSTAMYQSSVMSYNT